MLYNKKRKHKEIFLIQRINPMTIGEKIRKYRLLNNMTQKELGKKALGKIGDSALRIYKYESDLMAPKTDYRQSIADALGVDIEALSDVNIQSDADIMHVLFLLEEYKGLRIQRDNGKIVLCFDEPDSDNNNGHLLSYLNFWEYEASKAKDTDEEKTSYKLWKGKFVSNAEAFFNQRKKDVEEYYRKLVKKQEKNISYSKTTSDVAVLLRKIVDSGITLSTKYIGDKGQGYSFVIDELLDSSKKESQVLFATFLAEINHFNDLGACCFSEVTIRDGVPIITYYVPIPTLSVIGSIIKDYINSLRDPDNEWLIKKGDNKFKADLGISNKIEEEIKFYAPRFKR